MNEQKDMKSNFSALEIRIQKLIHLHEEAKKRNQSYFEIQKLKTELTDEHAKVQRLEEGYRNLKEIESTSTKQSISNMKRKINDIIGEIDRSMSMIDDNHK
ncbi:MAG: hypothetical protein IPN88_13860 [Bacteroidetes bacterium]|nr:hypothetical protein [Bacteroidota bacterium]